MGLFVIKIREELNPLDLQSWTLYTRDSKSKIDICKYVYGLYLERYSC